MSTIERFEDIEAWQMARQLVQELYAVSRDGAFAKDFRLRDQIRGAGTSIMSNIAEGFERGGDAEFTQFLAIAKGSAGEVRSQLYVLLDQEYINQETFDELCSQTVEISSMITGLMKYLRKSTLKGSKYK